MRQEYAMPALTLKNIPEELYNSLKEAATRHHRSLNSEIIDCLEKSLHPQTLPPAQRLAHIRQLRGNMDKSRIKPTDIKQAINSGRP